MASTGDKKQVFMDIVGHVIKCEQLLSYNSKIVESPSFILFLLSAYNDGVMPSVKVITDSYWREEFYRRLNEDIFYKNIFINYEGYVKDLNPQIFDELIFQINQIDRSDLSLEFSEIFEILLSRFIQIKGKAAGESVLPKQVSELIMELAELKKSAEIYNPFAGLASFAMHLEEGQHYIGQELNFTTWCLAQLRLNATEGHLTDDIILADSIQNWMEDKKFDLVVASPPFNMRLNTAEVSKLTEEPYSTVESFFVDKGINSLTKNGQLIGVFTASFLSNVGNQARLRKVLVDANLIDTIILLPIGLLSNTAVSTCIIIFKKRSKQNGKLKLVDASTFFYLNAHNKLLDNRKILQSLKNDEENEFVKHVTTKEVASNYYNLNVGRYFLENQEGVRLSSISTFLKGKPVKLNQQLKYVQIKDLKEDVFGGVLNIESLSSQMVENNKFTLIEETCVLVASRRNNLKPTLFQYSGVPIAIPPQITAIRLNEVKVNPTFLINEFSAKYVKKQLDSYRIGSVQTMISNQDLGEIKLRLPSIKEQYAKVSGILELSTKLKQLEVEKQSLLNGIMQEQAESSTSLSHVLGKPLLSIGSSLEIIQNALFKIDQGWENYMISEGKKFTLFDAFDSVSKNLKYIQELADNNTSLLNVSSFELSYMDFLKFLKQFIKDERKSLKKNISIILDIHEDIKNEMDNMVFIMGNTQRLRIALINLIHNAKTHAFQDNNQLHIINIEILPFTKDYEEASSLNFEIDPVKSYVEVRVSNTGASFPKDFSLEDYVRKNFSAGKTRNLGLGGYEINEIIKAHNEGKSALNFVSNRKDSKYSSTISFILPIL